MQTIDNIAEYLNGGGTTASAPTVVPTATTPIVDVASKRQQALAAARLNIQQELQRRGMPTNSYLTDFDSYLNNIANTYQGEDLGSYLPSTLAGDVLTGIQNRSRNDYRGQVQNTFGQNSGIDAIPDTFLDSTINDILSTQFGNAQSTLDRGRARGIYNDRGYQAGQASLANQRSQASAKLNTTEGDILSGYRSRLGDVRNNAFNAATGYQLGDSFDIGEYLRQKDSIVGEANTNAEGQLRSAIGSTPLYDFGSIGNAAGQAQGVVNLNNLDVRESLASRRARSMQGRGLGSQGAF